jgi:hypothetical protein
MSVSVAKKPWTVKGNESSLQPAGRRKRTDGRSSKFGFRIWEVNSIDDFYGLNLLPNRLINEQLTVSDLFISIFPITWQHDQGLPGVY